MSEPSTLGKDRIMADVFIEDYEEPVKVNPYSEFVRSLIAEDGKRADAARKAGEEYGTKERPEPVARLTFDTEKEARNALLKIQAATLEQDRSARKVGEIDDSVVDGDVVWTLRVKLSERRIRRSAEEIAEEKAAAEAKRQEKAEKAAKAPVAA